MRLLHTSDWHLGQSLNQYERSFEHAQFLGWLLDTLEAEKVDALVIAGDVFDSTNPSAASQTLLYQFLTQARRRVPHLGIVMTAGNHDSPGRMEAPAPFLSLFDAIVVGQIGGASDCIDWDRIVVPLKNRTGQVAAWCIAMPFLRPSDAPRMEGAADTYMAGVGALYASAYEHAAGKRNDGQAIIAMGHCHTIGGKVSEDSERRIVIGGSEALSASVFDPGIAYVALGHLHLAQKVGGDPSRRYCGSPLPMSFSEIDYPHQVVVVELDGANVSSIREVPIPRSVDLLRVPKQAAPLDEVLEQLKALSLPDLPESQWPYLQVRVQLTQPEPSLRTQIESALAGKPVRLVRIETTSAKTAESQAAPLVSIDELSNLAPAGFFERLYRHRYGESPPADIMAAFTELVNTPVESGAAT
jgi:exonuclease SbcD